MSGSQRSVKAGQSSGAFGIFGFAFLEIGVMWVYRFLVIQGGVKPADGFKDLMPFLDWVQHLLFIAHPAFGIWMVFTTMVGGVAMGRFFGGGTKIAEGADFGSLSNSSRL